jgi:SAM-dependent methyltransferase
MDWALSRPKFIELRKKMLSNVDGAILELGCGTGLNLLYYPPHIKQLSVIEPNHAMQSLQQTRAVYSGIKIDRESINTDNKFDISTGRYNFVISSWVLCSVPNLEFTLSEICRVLKSGGRFIFVEHGLAPDKRIAKWQSRLNIISRFFSCGCHLDRNHFIAINKSGMHLEKAEEFYIPGVSRLGGYTYFGIARRCNVYH